MLFRMFEKKVLKNLSFKLLLKKDGLALKKTCKDCTLPKFLSVFFIQSDFNPLNASVALIQKPVNRFAVQIN